MTPTGWLFLTLSWGLLLALIIFCFAKVFRKSAR